MTNTESRKEFEEWIEFEFPCSHERLLQKGGSGVYADTMTHWYWRAWQASRAKPIVLPMPWIEEVEPDVLAMRTICKAAIEAAGYRCE